MKRLLPFLSATVGAGMGVIFFIVFAALIAELFSEGNALMFGFVMVFAIPAALLLGGGIGIWLGLRIFRALQSETDYERRRLLELRTLAGVFLCFPGAIAMMCWGIAAHSAPPADAVLLANFNSKEAVFNQLASMVKADNKLVPINENWTAPDIPNTTSLTNSRVNEYRRRLKTVNVPRGFRVQDDREIRFYYYIRGSGATSDRIKGYAFLIKSPKDLRKQLDDCKGEFLVYRHIRGNWYLFYQYLPG